MPDRSAPFFFAGELPVDAAGVHLQAEALAYRTGQLRGAQLRIGRARFGDELEHLRGELVRAVRARLVAQQAGQATLLEGGLCLVERWARQAAGLGRLADRTLVDIDQPQDRIWFP